MEKDKLESKIETKEETLENYKDFKLKDELLAKKKELGGEE